MGASKLKHTEFRNSLIMQIYANLFKKKCYFSSILQQILILLFYLIVLVMQNYSKSAKMLPFLYFAADLDSVCFI